MPQGKVRFEIDCVSRKTILALTALRGGLSFLEIIFVGQCEAFVCLEFVEIFFFFFFSLAAKHIGPQMECQFFKNVDFFDTLPLNNNELPGLDI